MDTEQKDTFMTDVIPKQLPLPNDVDGNIFDYRCGRYPPWEERGINSPCILEEHHSGPHLVRDTDGMFSEWYINDEYVPNPEVHDDEEMIYGELSSADAAKRLAASSVIAQKNLTTSE